MNQISETRQRIDAAREALWPTVCNVTTQDCHWLSGPTGLVDEALDYCRDCANKRLSELSKAHPDEEFFLSCSCGGHEKESPASCNDCGVILDYVLLTYGVYSEINHFLENGVTNIDGDLCPADAYAIDRILNSVIYSKRPNDLSDALRIAETSVSLINYSRDDARMSDDGCPIPPRDARFEVPTP